MTSAGDLASEPGVTSAEPVRIPRRAILIAAVLAAAAIGGILLLSRVPEVPMFSPSASSRIEADGAHTFTLDASAENSWSFFSIARGTLVAPESQWDLAFQRFHIIANGGRGFRGRGGIVDLGRRRFDSVRSLPTSGYVDTSVGRDSVNPAIARWYTYGFTTHLLTPNGHVYGVRTADGNYAKFEVVSYYCPGPVAGCVTFRYRYNPDGTTTFAR
jgi:hypothetical protein